MSIDPLTEEYEDYTPYQFSSNQPVHARELEGLESSDDLNKKPSKENNYYNSETGNTDGGAWLSDKIGDALDAIGSLFTPSEPQKRSRSDKDMETTMTSKVGGNENPTSTGKTGGNTDGGAIVAAAPGAQKSGNKYGKTKDILTYVKDVVSGEKKGEKAADGVQNVVKENTGTPKRNMTVTNSNGVSVISKLAKTEAQIKADSLQATKSQIGSLPVKKVEINR